MLAGSLLDKLATAHQGGKDNQKRPLNFGVYYKNTLVALCHALEDFVIEAQAKPLMITAFQRGKWYLQEADRYGDLAEKSSQVVIMAAPEGGFGDHPTSQKANVFLVSLQENDPVAIEWHLMILSPSYTAMVLCQELSETDYGLAGIPTDDRQRKFYGFWTFEPELVTETVKLAIEHIQGYDPQLAQQLREQVKQIQQTHIETRDDLGTVVTKVVQYLQLYQENLPLSEQHLDHNLISNEMQAFLRMAQLIDQADPLNPNTAAEVAALSEAMAQLLDLPAWQIKRLRLAGLLHRLAPLQAIVVDSESLAVSETSQASVLRIMPQLQAIAQIITHQQEHWDGTGLPGHLAYDQIPLESRILGLTAYFQGRVTFYQNDFQNNQSSISGEEKDFLLAALVDCQGGENSLFDPKLVEALGLLVRGLEQGMTLTAYQPKIASGMWLLDN